MTVELNPVGVKCNLACTYCYETEMREAGNYGPRDYDLATMQAGLLDELRGGMRGWTLHGGEPLLMPIEDLEAMWAWGHARGHELGVQTNGTLLTDAHIALAQKYHVHVGVSIDGPGEMNDLRVRAGRADLARTRVLTARSETAIERLRAAGVGTSVIIVLHALNMAPERRSTFKQWLRRLDALGVSGARFHPLEIDGSADQHAPSIDDYIAFYRDMRTFVAGLSRLRVDLIEDIWRLQRGEDNNVTCTWNTCDPYTTAAVHGVDGRGERSNCGRTNKDGVAHPKADRAGYERYLALYYTPQEHGGCQGCRFFSMCTGQCPGEGLDGDWRNRSMYCRLYMALFTDVEADLVRAGQTPVSLAEDREQIEQAMVAAWARGHRAFIYQIRSGEAVAPNGHADVPHGDYHGDHTDAGEQAPPAATNHDDCGCHGDAHSDHGDAHGDHTDG